MKYNVIHIHNYSTWGGNTEHISIILRGINKDKFNVMFAGPFCCKYLQRFKEMGIRVLNSEIRNKFDLSALINLIRIFKREKIDIVHTHIRPADFFGSLAAKIAKVPVCITTLHNKINIDQKGIPYKGLSTKIYNFVLRNFFDRIITVSYALKEDIIKNINISPEKVIHIINGIEIQRFQEKIDKKSERQQLGLDKDAKLIGMVAKFVDNYSLLKGHPYFIEAAKKILSTYPNKVKFLLIGDGETKSYYERLVHQNNLQDRIIFLGFRKDIEKVLQILDISVLPSLYEGAPRAILESMACGTPVIATDIDGIREIIENNKTGILVKPKDSEMLASAIMELLNNEEKANSLSISAKEKIEKYYDAKIMVKEVERVYEELVKIKKH